MSPTKRFGYSLCVWFVVVALLLSGCGVKQPKVHRVGVLCGLGFTADVANGFKDKMTELGYVEGENIVYDYRQLEFNMAEFERILQKFVDDKVDLIFVFPTEPASVAKEVTRDTGIPVLFDFSFIENTGLVNSLREPGGNLTGVRYPGPDIALRRFEIMRQLAPDAKRIWLPYQRGLPIIQPQLDVLAPLAEAGGAMMEVDGYSTIYGVIVAIYKTGELAAPLADKILKGADPSTMPVVSPEMFFQLSYTMA